MTHQSLNTDHVMIRIEHMEALVLESIKQIGKSIEGLKLPQQEAAPSMAPLEAVPGQNWQMLNARLSVLEESFANICNTLGRLDQEFSMIKQALSQGEK